MKLSTLRDQLERSQILLYGLAVAVALTLATVMPGASQLEAAIKPALALMLFVTFLQVPMAELGRAFGQLRFLGTLLLSNFVAIPLLVALLVTWVPSDPLVRLGVLLVLLAPCIDWVVTFSHLGGADARLLLAATPALLVVQMLLLPVYLGLFLGEAAGTLVQARPFVDAFVELIVLPLAAAALLQHLAARSAAAARVSSTLGLLPVPATALVLFVVIGSVTPQLGAARQVALQVLPVHVGFAVLAPVLGWLVARYLARLAVPAARAVAFSSATRNSLVVLPLALAIPGAVPVLPAVIVTQTLVELLASLVYMRMMPRVGNDGMGEDGA